MEGREIRYWNEPDIVLSFEAKQAVKEVDDEINMAYVNDFELSLLE